MITKEYLEKLIRKIMKDREGNEFKLFTTDIKTLERFQEAFKEEAKRLNINFDDKKKA